MQFMDIKNGRFYLGDCLEVMKEIPDGVIDLTVTSPPYDNLREYGKDDEWTFDKFKAIAKELTRITKQGGVIVWNVADATVKGSETGSSFKQALYFKDECGLNLHDTMIYHKSSQPKQNGHRYEQHFEYMFVFAKGKPNSVNIIREPSKHAGKQVKRTSRDGGKDSLSFSSGVVNDTKAKGNVWFYGQKENKLGHPAIFPMNLARDHIISWSNEGDLVFDPFGGSGTTAVAAENLNRKWVTCEINEEYANLAVERILNHSPEIKQTSEVRIDSDIPMPKVKKVDWR